MRAQRRGLSGAAAGLQEVCKRRGFVFPNSESYGGVANSFDYGPLGCQMKKNVKDLWWSEFIEMEERVEGMDSGIMMNPKVWEATGHVDNFSDPLVECLDCHHRVRYVCGVPLSYRIALTSGWRSWGSPSHQK